MATRTTLRVRCLYGVATLNREMGWGLDAAGQQGYSTALLHYVTDTCSDAEIRRVILNYHQDHALVVSLMDQRHEQHDTAWNAWMARVVPILRRAGLAWIDDPAVTAEDLAQVARAELARSLPSFRYASRFSSWAHQVIVRSVQRYLRDQQARKRNGRPLSLDQLREVCVPTRRSDHPEALAEARLLIELINTILLAQPDTRLIDIFRLWAYADARLAEIGRHVHLSQSQVYVLLEQTLHLLQQDSQLQLWLGQHSDDVIP